MFVAGKRISFRNWNGLLYQCFKTYPRYGHLCIMWNEVMFQPVHYYWNSLSLWKGLDPNWGTGKLKNKRKIKLAAHNQALRDDSYYEEIEKQLQPLKAIIRKQGNVVHHLKESGAPDADIKNEVRKLKAQIKELENMIAKLTPTDTFDLARMNDLVQRKFYYATSFDIYGGFTGQYDYGPLGCQIVENLLNVWHQHFVVQEGMMKVSCPSLTPEPILRATGHVDKFTDIVVRDESSGEIFRLDHLIRSHLEVLEDNAKNGKDERRQMVHHIIPLLDGMNKEELGDLMKEYGVKSPTTGNALSKPTEMNLMFPVSIGSSSSPNGFLRPETAQGIFTNFKKLLDLKQGKLPFACAQVGNVFRNELSPKSGLIRVREFTLAEIEHFCFPDDKSHPKFDQVSDTLLWLYSAYDQLGGKRPKLTSVGEAVREMLVANETLGFYLARTQQFLLRVGISPLRLRFRQHLSAEMAHYASDCWDAECLTSQGWVECVGVADRSVYDLSCHAHATGANLSVERPLPEPRLEEGLSVVVDEEALEAGLECKAAAVARRALHRMKQEDLRRMSEALDAMGIYHLAKGLTVTKKMVPEFKKTMKEIHTENVIPSVVEPSFGIGRIFSALLEHSFRWGPNWPALSASLAYIPLSRGTKLKLPMVDQEARVREDDRRTYFALPPFVAPVNVAVLAIINLPKFAPFVQRLVNALTKENLLAWSEASRNAIGRQYVHMDERSVPFCVTVDEDTLRGDPPDTVTLRERDSTQQVRLPMELVPQTVKNLSEGKLEWEAVMAKWPKFASQVSTK